METQTHGFVKMPVDAELQSEERFNFMCYTIKTTINLYSTCENINEGMIIATIPEGTRVNVKNGIENNNTAKIKYDDKIGYVKANEIYHAWGSDHWQWRTAQNTIDVYSLPTSQGEVLYTLNVGDQYAITGYTHDRSYDKVSVKGPEESTIYGYIRK